MQDFEKFKKTLSQVHSEHLANKKLRTPEENELDDLYIWELETTDLIGDFVLWLN
jgi:hypothetical protein